MLVRFWTFSKEVNSTARPSTSSVEASITGTLRENCSIASPVIGFTAGAVADFARYTYAQIGIFGGRYYFVDNWTWADGLWIASMRIDPLASFRNEIRASSQYVTRSASYFPNNGIMDSAYPATSYYTTANAKKAVYTADPCYILGLVGQGGGTGVVNYYIFTPAQFEEFSSKLTGTFIDAVQQGISEIGEDLTKVLFNPLQYVISCNYFPVSPPDDDEWYAPRTSVNVGWWTVNCACRQFTGDSGNTEMIHTSRLTLPDHPQSARGGYLRNEPYTSYYLTFRPFAVRVPLPSGIAKNERALAFTLAFDWTTGDGYLEVKGYDASAAEFVAATYPARFCVSVPLAQVNANIYPAAVSAAGGLIKGVAAGLASGSVSKAISTAFGGIDYDAVLDAMRPTVSITGIPASKLNLDEWATVDCIFRPIAEENRSRVGRVVMETMRLSDLTGFTMCANPHIDVDIATAGEREQIEAHMREGFYLE